MEHYVWCVVVFFFFFFQAEDGIRDYKVTGVQTCALPISLLQMLNHGITTGGLFLCVGLIYERTHSRMLADNGGLSKPMPRYATCLGIFALSSLALPGTNNFIGEFLGVVGSLLYNKAIAAAAALGGILAAGYLLWMVPRVALG